MTSDAFAALHQLRDLTRAVADPSAAGDLEALAQRATAMLVEHLGAGLAQVWLYDMSSGGLRLAAAAAGAAPGDAALVARYGCLGAAPWIGEAAGTRVVSVRHASRDDASARAGAGCNVVAVPILALDELRGVLASYSRTKPHDAAADVLATVAEILAALTCVVELAQRQHRIHTTTSEHRYQDMFDLAPDAYLVTDTCGTIHEANFAAGRLLGVKRGQLLGQSLAVYVATSDIRDFRWLLAGLADGGEGAHWDLRLQPRHGPPVHVSLAVAVVRDAAHRPVAIRWLMHDVTARRRAEEEIRVLNVALARLGEQRDLVLNTAGEGICGLDEHGRVTFVNPAAAIMTGYTHDDLIGRSLHDVLQHSLADGRPYPAAESPVNATLHDGAAHHAAGEVFWRKDGTSFPVEYVSTPVVEGREVGGAVLVFRDVTQRRHAEQRVLLLQRIALAIGEAETLESALTDVLRSVCEATGWVLGQAWAPQEHCPDLACVARWSADGPTIEPFSLESTSGRMETDRGLLGRVWQRRAAAWVRDVSVDPHFLRSAAARAAGLRGALVVPVLEHGSPVAVLEFYMTESRDEDERLVGVVSAVAAQLGTLILRKRAEDALRESEERFRRLAENAHDVIYRCELLPQRRFTYVSPAVASLTGYAAETFCGEAAALHALPHPDDLGAIGAILEGSIPAEPVTLRLRHRDGHFVWTEHRLVPIRDAEGRLVALEGIARDVTDRTRAEAEQARLLGQAEAAEARFRGLVESAPDAIISVDQQGRIALVNSQTERLFGYRRAELLGEAIEILLPERFRAGHVGHRERYSRTPRTRPMGTGLQLAGRRKDGSEFPVEVSLSPLLVDDRLLVTSIVRDVTEKHALERQKDQFLAAVSHDLRTPLAGIKASIGVMLANEPPGMPEPLHRMLVNVDLAADRMARMVADLLELTRLKAGRVQLRPVECDMRDPALRSAQAIEALAQGRGQRLLLDLPAAVVPGVVDVERIERVLLNLLGNAQKYGHAGGTITLGLAVGEDEVVFTVADDGPGIPPNEQQRIFDLFYRSETYAVQMNQGAGLGLPISRALVELHGGRIWVNSTLGAGATFHVALPRMPGANRS